MSSQPSILTGIDPELWIAVGSRLHIVEGRYHLTVWNTFYPAFVTLIKKNMTEEAKLFSPSSYISMS
jgi:hypothetical protein